MKIIEIKILKNTYDGTRCRVHAINGVDCQSNVCEFTAIVGPAGSGKTTLLIIVAGSR